MGAGRRYQHPAVTYPDEVAVLEHRRQEEGGSGVGFVEISQRVGIIRTQITRLVTAAGIQVLEDHPPVTTAGTNRPDSAHGLMEAYRTGDPRASR